MLRILGNQRRDRFHTMRLYLCVLTMGSIKRHLSPLILLLVPGVLLLLWGCSSPDDGNDADTGTGSSDAHPSTGYTASPPPNPILSGSGIRVSTVGSFMPGWPRVTRICEADGYVVVRDGIVLEAKDGFDSDSVQLGETIYERSGDPYVDSTLTQQAVYRDESGKLINSYRSCELSPDEGYSCEDDGYAWVSEGIVTEVITQPSGEKTSPGEVVYGPFGEPLSSDVPTSMPVFRNEAGQLEYGWPACDPPYRRDTATP